MDTKIHKILVDYIKSIQEQIKVNQNVITDISLHIEESRKIRDNTNDSDELNRLAEKSFNFLKEINLHIKKQEVLFTKFCKFSTIVIDDVIEKDIPILVELLEHNIKLENYERCAILRDSINHRKSEIESLKNTINEASN
jgi:hypothetical protein